MSTTAVVACGAWPPTCGGSRGGAAGTVDVHPLPALLHNRPELIAAGGRGRGDRLADATTVWRSPTPTAGPTARSTRCWAGAASRGCAGEHCYDLIARERGARGARGGARAPTS